MKGITVIKNYAKAIPVVHASEGELRQAFIAIITNALDAMQDNGTLTLETGIGRQHDIHKNQRLRNRHTIRAY